jgi:hypothetical protein
MDSTVPRRDFPLKQLLLLIVAIAAVGFLLTLSPLPPSRAIWEAGSDTHSDSLRLRRRVARWIVLAGTFSRSSRGQVVAELGEPDVVGKFGPESLAYDIGGANGYRLLEKRRWLVFEFDTVGVVAKTKIENDH